MAERVVVIIGVTNKGLPPGQSAFPATPPPVIGERTDVFTND